VGVSILRVEYAEQREKYGVLFIFSMFSVPCACVLVSPLYYKPSVNTQALDMHVFMPYTELTRRNTLFVYLWLRHRNT